MVKKFVVVLVTVPSRGEADRITRVLLKNRLAACVNWVPHVLSSYWWKGKIEHSKEVLLVIKSIRSKVPRLVSEVKRLHSYAVPEVIALPILAGNPEYLRWVDEEV